MDDIVYRNEFLKIIFTMFKQRSRNWNNNNNNRGFKISLTMNVFEFEEVHQMSSGLGNCDGSVDVPY